MTEIEFLENIVSEMDEIQKNQDIALKLSAYAALMFLVRGRLSALEGKNEIEKEAADPKVELMTGFWPKYDENKEYVRGDTVDSTGKKMGKDWYRFPEWAGHVYTYDPERG